MGQGGELGGEALRLEDMKSGIARLEQNFRAF